MAIDDLAYLDDFYPPRIQGPRDSLDSLCKCTNFDKREIQLMYRSFKQECPLGICNEEKFREVLSRFFPYGNASVYAQHVFRTLDVNKDKQISFKEFLIWLSQLSRGTLEDKLRWIFSLYDINNDGVVTRRDICDIISSVYSLLGKRTLLLSDKHLEEKADQFLEKIGAQSSRENAITLEQFLEMCCKDESIGKSVSYLDTII